MIEEEEIIEILLFLNKQKSIPDAMKKFSINGNTIRTYLNKARSRGAEINYLNERKKRNWENIVNQYKKKQT